MKKIVLSLVLASALACGTCMPVAGAADAPGWQYANGAYAGEDALGRAVLGSGDSRTASEAVAELQPILGQELNAEIQPAVYRNGVQVNDDSVVATGDTIVVPSENAPVVIVVKGDVSGTGAPGLIQVIKISKALKGQEDLTPSQLEAADVNNSGKVDLGDVVAAAKAMNSATGVTRTTPEASAEAQSKADARPKATTKPSATVAAKSAMASNAVTAKFAKTVVDGTNSVRAKNGVTPALVESARLSEAAQVRANELAASGKLSHTRPDGSKYSTVCTLSKGIVVGENIHCNKGYPLDETANVAMKGWENSAPHLKQMLEPRYSHIGLGFAQGSDGTWYCVQLFSNGNSDSVLSIDTPKA